METVQAMMQRYLRVSGPPSSSRWMPAHCPFHDDRSASFAVQLDSGVGHCYVCGSFNLKTIMSRVGVPLGVQTSLLRSLYGDRGDSLGMGRCVVVELPPPVQREIVVDEFVLSRMIPVQDPNLVGSGFTHDTLRHFNVLDDPVTGRVAWPIRDMFGGLRAISGRHRDPDRSIAKYKVYREELHHIHPGYECNNRNYLFHFENVYPSICVGAEVELILVEGFKAAAWVYQTGFRHVCAVMGSKITPEQFKVLSQMQLKRVILFLDNNQAGWDGTFDTAEMLLPLFDVYVVEYPDERGQPDDLTSAEVITAVVEPIAFIQWSEKNMQRRKSMTAGGSMYGRPDRRGSGGGGLGSSQKLNIPVKDGRRWRVRFIRGEHKQLLWDSHAGAVVQADNDSFFRTIHWPPYEVGQNMVNMDQLLYNNKAWGGPIHCTAGPNPEEPRPCIGCYLSNERYTNSEGKSKQQATLENQRLFSLVALHWFHPVQKTNPNTGKTYTSWELCQLDERTGRGTCPHCVAGLERTWGRKLYAEMRYYPGVNKGPVFSLFEFSDSISRMGVCGCSVFPQSFWCERCDGQIMNLDDTRMSDADAEQFAATPQTCPHCGHFGPVLESLTCNQMTPQGVVITSCAGVEARDMWNTDIFISSRKDGEGNQARWVTTFEAGVSGPLPFAPPDVENWPETWEKLNTPFDFEGTIRLKSLPQQLQAVGMTENPYMDTASVPQEAPTVAPPVPAGAVAPGTVASDPLAQDGPEY